MKEAHPYGTLKAEGYLFVPYQGQLRFGVLITNGVLSIVAPHHAYHHHFGSSPTSPACRAYEENHNLADLERIKEFKDQIKYFMVNRKAKKVRIQMTKGYIDLFQEIPTEEKK